MVYACVAGSYEYGGHSIISIGNATLVGGSGNDEPFLITYNAAGNNTQMFTESDASSRTVHIYQTEDIKVSWENVTDKPFYEGEEETILQLETSMSFNYDPEVDNAAYLHKATPTDDFAQMWESDWNAAEVVWDGVSYTVVPPYQIFRPQFHLQG